MSTFLAENFWGIGICGFLSALFLLFLLVQTGRIAWLIGAAVAALVTMVLLAIEVRTVTTREEIASTLQQIARDLESNDHTRILRHVSPNSPQLLQHAQKMLPRMEFRRASVKSNLTIQPFPNSNPEKLAARFNAVIVGSDRRAGVENQLAPLLFIVDFEKIGSEWKATRYEHHDPRGESFDVVTRR